MLKSFLNLKNIIILFNLSLFICAIVYLNINKGFRIAHKGGAYNETLKTNSINTIEKSKKKINYFEIDFQLTKDNRLICLHPNDNEDLSNKNIRELFFKDIKKILDLNDKCYDDLITKLLKNNPKMLIITDFKENNIEGLNFISQNFSKQLNQFVPQIYFAHEYEHVKKMGFNKIIFILYKIPNLSNEEIIEQINDMDLYAVTMDPARLRKGLAKILKKQNIFTYVHTVNSYARFLQYKIFYKADEIYTDKLF